MECVIFTNGYIDDYNFLKQDYYDCYIISCDGGLKHIDKLNIEPSILIGDFDSVDNKLFKKYNHIGKMQYPTDKDYTDTELAILHAKQKGFDKAIIYGATGGRIDHTLGNIFLLKKANELGIDVCLIDDLQEIRFVNKSIEIIENHKNKTLSIIPLETIEFINSKGLLYSLNDLKFLVGDTRPISNVIVDDSVEINVKYGSCLVIINNKLDL